MFNSIKPIKTTYKVDKSKTTFDNIYSFWDIFNNIESERSIVRR